MITIEYPHYPKLKDIAHLLSINDDFDVSLDDVEVGTFKHKALIDNHGEAYVTYISYGVDDYGDYSFMVIDLVSDKKLLYKGGKFK